MICFLSFVNGCYGLVILYWSLIFFFFSFFLYFFTPSTGFCAEAEPDFRGIAFTANVRLKFPVYQKLVKFIWFQLIFYLLVTAVEQVLKTEK